MLPPDRQRSGKGTGRGKGSPPPPPPAPPSSPSGQAASAVASGGGGEDRAALMQLIPLFNETKAFLRKVETSDSSMPRLEAAGLRRQGGGGGGGGGSAHAQLLQLVPLFDESKAFLKPTQTSDRSSPVIGGIGDDWQVSRVDAVGGQEVSDSVLDKEARRRVRMTSSFTKLRETISTEESGGQQLVSQREGRRGPGKGKGKKGNVSTRFAAGPLRSTPPPKKRGPRGGLVPLPPQPAPLALSEPFAAAGRAALVPLFDDTKAFLRKVETKDSSMPRLEAAQPGLRRQGGGGAPSMSQLVELVPLFNETKAFLRKVETSDRSAPLLSPVRSNPGGEGAAHAFSSFFTSNEASRVGTGEEGAFLRRSVSAFEAVVSEVRPGRLEIAPKETINFPDRQISSQLMPDAPNSPLPAQFVRAIQAAEISAAAQAPQREGHASLMELVPLFHETKAFLRRVETSDRSSPEIVSPAAAAVEYPEGLQSRAHVSLMELVPLFDETKQFLNKVETSDRSAPAVASSARDLKQKMCMTGAAARLVQTMFEFVDADESGFLEASEGKDFLFMLGTRLDELEYYWKDMLRVADTNKDGKISQEEYLRYIMGDMEVAADGSFADAAFEQDLRQKLEQMRGQAPAPVPTPPPPPLPVASSPRAAVAPTGHASLMELVPLFDETKQFLHKVETSDRSTPRLEASELAQQVVGRGGKGKVGQGKESGKGKTSNRSSSVAPRSPVLWQGSPRSNGSGAAVRQKLAKMRGQAPVPTPPPPPPPPLPVASSPSAAVAPTGHASLMELVPLFDETKQFLNKVDTKDSSTPRLEASGLARQVVGRGKGGKEGGKGSNGAKGSSKVEASGRSSSAVGRSLVGRSPVARQGSRLHLSPAPLPGAPQVSAPSPSADGRSLPDPTQQVRLHLLSHIFTYAVVSPPPFPATAPPLPLSPFLLLQARLFSLAAASNGVASPNREASTNRLSRAAKGPTVTPEARQPSSDQPAQHAVQLKQLSPVAAASCVQPGPPHQVRHTTCPAFGRTGRRE